MKPITIKPDKRFKLGNVKRRGRELRGHPDTVKRERLYPKIWSDPTPNPPLVITRELAKKLKGLL